MRFRKAFPWCPPASAVTLSASVVWKAPPGSMQQTVHVRCAILEQGALKEPSSRDKATIPQGIEKPVLSFTCRVSAFDRARALLPSWSLGSYSAI